METNSDDNNNSESNNSMYNNNIDYIKIQKMAFIYNALENGWNVKKKNNLYVFEKKHNNSKEVYLDSYLKRFMVRNMDETFLNL